MGRGASGQRARTALVAESRNACGGCSGQRGQRESLYWPRSAPGGCGAGVGPGEL